MDQGHEQAARTRSHRLWQESGCTHGHDREDWSQAEREIEAAEEPIGDTAARGADGRRPGDGDASPWTPVALFYATAQAWIEFGRVIAGLAVWPVPPIRAGRAPSAAGDGTDKAA